MLISMERADQSISAQSDTSTSSGPRVKRTRTNETERLQRIAYAEESVSDIAKQIGFKEKRREQLTNTHNYGECEKISEEISSLKRKRFELQAELTKLKRRQQQSTWYKQSKKQRKASVGNVQSDQSDTETNAPLTSPSIQSSRSTTPVASPFPPQSPNQLASSNPSNERSTIPAASLQSPDQLAPSSPSNEQSHAHAEGEMIVLSDQEESSTATASEQYDTGLLLPDGSDSSSNL